jgi:hypothetical protein
MKAAGFYVALDVPKADIEKTNRLEESGLFISEEVKKELEMDMTMSTNILTVSSVGPDVKDGRLKKGTKVIVNPSVMLSVLADENDKRYIVIPESHIMMLSV